MIKPVTTFSCLLLLLTAMAGPDTQGDSQNAVGFSQPDLQQQAFGQAAGETGQPGLHQTHSDNNKLMIFFAIGLVLNLLFLSLFLVWAVKQWRKHKSPSARESEP